MSFPCHSLVISMRGRSSFDLNQLLLSTYTPPLTVAVFFFSSVASSVGLVGVMFVWKQTAFCLHNRESICQACHLHLSSRKNGESHVMCVPFTFILIMFIVFIVLFASDAM